MARVVGSKATADGTRYFAATDRTLEGVKRDKDIVRQLAPQSLRSGDERVRKVLVFVDIERHMALRVPKGEEIRVGTVLIESRTAPDVDATISVADFTLIGIKNHENK